MNGKTCQKRKYAGRQMCVVHLNSAECIATSRLFSEKYFRDISRFAKCRYGTDNLCPKTITSTSYNNTIIREDSIFPRVRSQSLQNIRITRVHETTYVRRILKYYDIKTISHIICILIIFNRMHMFQYCVPKYMFEYMFQVD